MKLLRWAGWSRAGQLVYNQNNLEPSILSAGETIRPEMLLASRNQMRCDSYLDGEKNCAYIPAGNYGIDSPIWGYANVSAPIDLHQFSLLMNLLRKVIKRKIGLHLMKKQRN
ncbi:hypothetical protein BKK55_09575 [Rodentibacter genomosp. 2]|uniref:Uncharacterized protein n=1 Tax=Rodentibacter genomosp. 2 TaxID=1908266 RepID=A0A1V3JC82_9PAST|nr:hypothetical protein [Rodentibacter genomosp. 2]OOF54310.1 hypothetical protein BKK55_09575 [Rodentibacter genomosp. 2]